MKIGIDISQIVYETGVSWYTIHLVKNLFVLDQNDKYVLFAGTLRQKDKIDELTKGFEGNFEIKIFPFSPTMADFFWNRLRFPPVELFMGQIDVFHSSDWSLPPTSAFKVTTVHDLSPIKFPSLTPSKIVSVHERRLNLVKTDSDRIIVPSKATKEDLLELGFSENKIRVIPEAPDHIFYVRKPNEINEVKKKYDLAGEYLLAIGTSPRKNTKKIIQAFKKLKNNKGIKLVIAGRGSFDFELPQGVLRPGHIEQADLPALYSGAFALVYPSLYEGFGLPVLEAYATGCPVVTSNLSSMKEIAADAAALVDPNSIDDISYGISKVLSKREYYIKKGLSEVKKYSWEKVARETLKVYNEKT